MFVAFIFFQDDICVETEDGVKHCKLIAVHAGLEKNRDVKEQLKFLKARDTSVPKVEALSGRKNVWDIPQVMAQPHYLGLFIASHNNISAQTGI